MAIKDIETIFDDAKAEKEEKYDNDETDAVNVSFYVIASGTLGTSRCYLQKVDVASNTTLHRCI